MNNFIQKWIEEFMNCNKGKLVVVRQMVVYTNKTYFSERDQLKVNYREVYSCLKNQMNFGWRKAS